MAHACNPTTLGGQDGQEFKMSLASNDETPPLLKIQKLARYAFVVPASWEAEIEESLELGRQRLQ